eukprot:sb/3472704/
MMLFVVGVLLTRVFGGEFSSAECKPIEVNGYLHEHCPKPDSNVTYFKCPRSNKTYRIGYGSGDCDSTSRFSTVCPSDPGFYQACGHSGCTGYRELAGTPLLCGTFICNGLTPIGHSYDFYYRCKSGRCRNTELNMGEIIRLLLELATIDKTDSITHLSDSAV